MKISEMMAALQTILKEHGDLEVCHFPDDDLMVIDNVEYNDGYSTWQILTQLQLHDPCVLLSGEKEMPLK